MTYLKWSFRSRPLVPTTVHEPLFQVFRVLYQLDRFPSQSSFKLCPWRKASFRLGSALCSEASHVSTWSLADWTDTESHISHSWPWTKVSDKVCESESSPPNFSPVWSKYQPLIIGNAWRCQSLLSKFLTHRIQPPLLFIQIVLRKLTISSQIKWTHQRFDFTHCFARF